MEARYRFQARMHIQHDIDDRYTAVKGLLFLFSSFSLSCCFKDQMT